MLNSLKRSRSYEDVGGEEHNESKKLRTLPFRSSLTGQHAIPSFSNRQRPINRPRLLTPFESSEDEESDFDSPLPEDKETTPSLSLFLRDADDDVDMDISEDFDQPVWSPKVPDSAFATSFPASARSNLSVMSPEGRSSYASTPRIPTPIYGHFSSPSYPPDTLTPSPVISPPYINTLAFPRIRSGAESKSDAFLRKRALPSPICEDDNMDSPDMTKTLLSNLKMTPISPITRQFKMPSTLTPDTPSTKTWTSIMDTVPRNRRRSDAISGESGKVTLAMGFRDDCAKCRDRIPGHYSHVVRA